MSKTLSKKTRFFIGLSDPAGVGVAYAKVLRKMGYQANCITYSAHPFSYSSDPEDYSLDLFRQNIVWRLIYLFFFFLKSMFIFDVFIFVYGATFFPFRNRFFVNIDMPILKIFGKKIISVFVGCDIRFRDQKTFVEYSGCFECREKCNYAVKKKIAEVSEKYSDLIFAQADYGGFLRKKYHLFWIPFDLEKYQPSYTANKKPIIIHAPSNTDLKGTKFILEAIKKLKREGFDFDFKLLKNKKHEEILEEIKKADFIVDSVLGGWYGMFAAESMALGKLVLGYIRPSNMKACPVPMINTHPDNVYDNLKKVLLMKPEERIRIGRKSRRFIEKHHQDIKVVQEQLSILKKVKDA